MCFLQIAVYTSIDTLLIKQQNSITTATTTTTTNPVYSAVCVSVRGKSPVTADSNSPDHPLILL